MFFLLHTFNDLHQLVLVAPARFAGHPREPEDEAVRVPDEAFRAGPISAGRGIGAVDDGQSADIQQFAVLRSPAAGEHLGRRLR